MRKNVGVGHRVTRIFLLVAVSTMLIFSSVVAYPSLFSASSFLPKQVFADPLSTPSNQTYKPSSTDGSSFGGNLDDAGYSIAATNDNGLVLAGYTKSLGAGGSDMWLIKLGLTPYHMEYEGTTITGTYLAQKWNMTYGGSGDECAMSVIQTADGGYALAGFTKPNCNSSEAGSSDMWLVKTDGDGSMQWNMTYGGAGDDAANCVIQTADGGYLLAGYTNSNVQSQTTWLVKTDQSGNLQWSKNLQGIAANSVIQTNDGGYALAVDYPNAFCFVKTDSNGETLVNETYAVSGDQVSTQAVVQASDGGYAIAGWAGNSTTGNSTAGSRDGWLVKLDESGQEQWNQTYLGLGIYGLVATSEGGYALTGDRACLIITDSAGNPVWNRTYDMESDPNSPYFTKMKSLLEVGPGHYDLVGVLNGAMYINGQLSANLQLAWTEIVLKSGEQIIPPQTTILSPTTNTTYTEHVVPLTFYVNESTRYLFISTSSDSFNRSLTGNTTLNLANGAYNITVFATDLNYNTAPSQTVSFTVNSTDPYVLPVVTIQSPSNVTYQKTSNQVILNFSVDQMALWTAYSLDGGSNRTAIPNLILTSLGWGNHALTVYAGSFAGGEAGSATVEFTFIQPSPVPNIFFPMPPYDNGSIYNALPAALSLTFNFMSESTLGTVMPLLAYSDSNGFSYLVLAALGMVLVSVGCILVIMKRRKHGERSDSN